MSIFFRFYIIMTTFYKSPRINLGRLMPMVSDIKNRWNFCRRQTCCTKTQSCEKCDTMLKKQSNRGYFVYFRCGKCKTRTSVRKGTILSNAKISFRRFILLIYAFCQFNWTYDQTQREACVTSVEESDTESGSSSLSSQSVDKYFRLFREIVCDHMFETLKSVKKIGGPGKHVEIDELQFGKWKGKHH